MKDIVRQLALDYLNEIVPAKKFGILLKVEKLLESYDWKTYGSFKKDFGFSYFAGINTSSKIVKGEKKDFSTLILYLSASNNAGKDLCKFASTGCRLACLVESGRAIMDNRTAKKSIHVSRLIKSWIVIYRRDLALKALDFEISRGKKKYDKFAVRLNGTSDIEWNDLMVKHSDVQFYDYTKDITRLQLPNYHLTFSYSEMSGSRVKHYKLALSRGINIAVPVIAEDFDKAIDLDGCFDADVTDLRFLDEQTSGFAILKAKITPDMKEGVKHKFFLTIEELKQLKETLNK